MSLPLIPLNVTLPIAGRLKRFLPNWELVTQDPWVLQVIQGYHIDFLETPVQVCPPTPMMVSAKNQVLLHIEVQKLASKEAIHLVSPGEGEQGFLSTLFLVPKKGGEQRPVVNLKPLNQKIPYEHFKVEGIDMLKDLLMKGEYLVKIDLKDAYMTVPIWHKHQTFLRFLRTDNMWEFACLSFGLASAPRVFTKLLKPVVSVLRRHIDHVPNSRPCTDTGIYRTKPLRGLRVCSKLQSHV